MPACTRVFLLLFSLLLPLSTAYAAAKPFIIAADEWCPINCTPGSSKEGFGIELARRVLEPLGYKVQYVTVPWSQALQDVRKGKVHAIVGASHNDAQSLIFPHNAIYNSTDDFYVRAGTPWQYQGMHTLKKKRIGIIKDYGYGDKVLDFIEANKQVYGIIHEAQGKDPLRDNIDALVNNQIDVLIENRAVMDYALRNSVNGGKVKWAGSLDPVPVYVAFSPALPDSQKLASYYDSEIRRLRSNGELKQIYAGYNISPPR